MLKMDTARQHWKILRELGTDLASRVRSFLVIGNEGNGVMVATEQGQGFWIGEMKFGSDDSSRTATKPMSLDVPELVQMAQGLHHILMLNKRGEIYSMGDNYYGQLGLGNVDQESHFTPKLISIPDTKFISVRCGNGHSLALTEHGKVWAWGSNYCGQVGGSDFSKPLQSPHQITELDSHRVVAIECGGHHSLALTDKGEVYSWGANSVGQLGVERELSTQIATQISVSSAVKSMAAGDKHTLLLTESGEVWACGANEDGQLGLTTDTKSSVSLVKVGGLATISQIASHPASLQSVAMTSDLRCFIWGKLRDGIISTPRELPPFYSTLESPFSFFFTHRCTPNSVQIQETPKSRLLTRMSRMFDNPKTSDIQFVVEQRTINAHRIIVNNTSDYFARMFSELWLDPVDPEDPVLKVTIPDYSYEVFHTFLRFIYTDSFEVYSDLIPKLLDLANFYLVPDLTQACLLRMRTTLSPYTCCLYYPLTQRHSLPELDAFQQELVQFASTRMSQITATVAYESMESDSRVNLVNAVHLITNNNQNL